MTAYVDSSVLLRIILEQPDPLDELSHYAELVTSALTQTECLRAIDNARSNGWLDQDTFEARRAVVFAKLKGISRVRLSRFILARADGSFPSPLGSLDAIHVATALAWRDHQAPDLVFATHDRQQARAALALGFEVIGV